MAYFALVILAFFSVSVNGATPFDMSEHSGFIRGSDGNYVKVSANGSVRSLTSNTALAVVEKPFIQTSKGALEVTLNRTAAVDIGRLGKAIGAFAQKVGPVSMAFATVDLICTLSNICNTDGTWNVSGSDPYPTLPNEYPLSDGQWAGYLNERWPSAQAACTSPGYMNYIGADSANPVMINPGYYDCQFHRPNGTTYHGYTTKLTGCSTQYTLSGSTCNKTGATAGHPANASDWTAKESLLNDSRFTPDLFNAGENVPITTPVLTGSPVTVPMGATTSTLKDGSGTVTGSQTATTSLSITDGATNSTPNVVNLSETTITNIYNESNVLQSSTTTTTDPQQPPKDSKVDPIEIKFDTVNDTLLTQKVVEAPFTSTSWGGGECPPDISMALSRGNYSIDSQPFCDFAISAKPLLLLVATIAAAYIVVTSTRPQS